MTKKYSLLAFYKTCSSIANNSYTHAYTYVYINIYMYVCIDLNMHLMHDYY